MRRQQARERQDVQALGQLQERVVVEVGLAFAAQNLEQACKVALGRHAVILSDGAVMVGADIGTPSRRNGSRRNTTRA